MAKIDRPNNDDKDKPPRAKRARKAKAALVLWLRAKGFRPADLTAKFAGDDIPAGLRRLHGVSAEEYRAAGGGS
jgi:hypothetical protein